MNNKFIIIIPTMNRIETLRGSLATVLSQNYQNYSVIISDNSIDDETQKYIKNLSDPRIDYYKTGGGLSMTENWNFALSKISDRNSFVSIMGDDDGLSINCLSRINEIIVETNLNSYVASWAYYKWKNLERDAGFLSFGSNVGYEIRNSIRDFKKVLLSKREYTQIPHIYTGGFIKFNEIEKIKKGDEFLGSIYPDVYSSVGLSLSVDKYVFIKENLVICGTSAKSNSAAICGLVSGKEAFHEFIQQNTHKIAPFFNGADLKNISLCVLDAYLNFMEKDSKLIVPPRMILINALKRGLFDYKNSKELVDLLLIRNNLKKINLLNRVFIYWGIYLNSFKKIYFYFLAARIYTGSHSIADIHQASIFMDGFLFHRKYKLIDKIKLLIMKIRNDKY
ncbi:glycosyltransferase family 2 protein [Polynucleobacter paneuropaeus]|uniref:glycosyltransferase family 2 protein n=1 Tax=Polynucleobacter paneuropaeus TaxID=2527775 RepID=UPI000DBF06C5|nr:glycosyltransferase [Polynucleobacter paneuropaeus]AWW44053.1 hypothetical protein DPM16_01700 [Polynucleobacter paneuropaeus]